MIHVLVSFVIGAGVGWGIRGMIKPKTISCKKCGFKSTMLSAHCPGCGSKNEWLMEV